VCIVLDKSEIKIFISTNNLICIICVAGASTRASNQIDKKIKIRRLEKKTEKNANDAKRPYRNGVERGAAPVILGALVRGGQQQQPYMSLSRAP
jgi:hypothetical protein